MRARILVTRFPLLLVFLQALLVCAPSSAATLNEIQSRHTIRIGVRDGSIPFSFSADRSGPVGYSVDICQRIVEEIGKSRSIPGLKPQFVAVSSADRIEKVRSGAVDIECGSTTLTRERMQQVDFSFPVFFAYMKIMTPAKRPVDDLKGLAGRKVAVAAGSSGETMLQEWNKAKNLGIGAIVAAKDINDAFGALVRGSADAFVTDDVILYGLRATLPKPNDYVVSQVKLTVEPVAFMLKKGDPAFRTAVNDAIKSLMQSGELTRIYAKWFEHPIAPSGKALKLPMSSLLSETIRFPMDVPPAY